jgi:sensor histidine kinase YesM
MGIALDNVTEAIDAMAAPPVHIALKKLKNALAIEVSNPLPRPLLYKNGEIQSTKAEGGHGLGLSALRRIAQKYNGEVTITDTEGTFSLSVMLFI